MRISNRTYKVVKEITGQKCAKCSHERKFKVVEERSWFLLVFIPLFPYKKRNLLVCSVCGAAYELKVPLEYVKKTKVSINPDQAYELIKTRRDKGEITENEFIRLSNLLKHDSKK